MNTDTNQSKSIKISRRYFNSPTWSLTAAIEYVLHENFNIALSDFVLCYRDFGDQSFTLLVPKSIDVNCFITLLSDLIFVGPSSVDLF